MLTNDGDNSPRLDAAASSLSRRCTALCRTARWRGGGTIEWSGTTCARYTTAHR